VNSSSYCSQFKDMSKCTSNFYYENCTGPIDLCLNNPKVYPCAWADGLC
jgi:hypothetical protein